LQIADLWIGDLGLGMAIGNRKNQQSAIVNEAIVNLQSAIVN
jgi:hypothetical protein